MWKNDNNYFININFSSDNMSAVLTDGESNLADYSFSVPRNNFTKFITMLRILVDSAESIASKKGLVVKNLIINISAQYVLNNGRIGKCDMIPVLNNVNFEDFFSRYAGKIKYADVLFFGKNQSNKLRVNSLRVLRRLNLKSI